jgi:hypothetical protein
MTSKRKAEIQRKLTLTAVPRPPDDLLDRIKGDIPKYLNVEEERERFSRSVGFNLRIAASIIVMLSIASLIFLVNERTPQPASLASAETPKPVVMRSTPAASVAAAPAQEEVHVDIVQAAPAPASIAPPPAARVAPPAEVGSRLGLFAEGRRDRDDEARNEVGVEGGVEGHVEGGVVGGVAGGVVAGEFAPQLAEAPPPPAAAPEPGSSFGYSDQSTRAAAKTAAAPSLIPQAYASDLDLAPKSVFGISIDPAAFRRIQSTIENGNRPSPSSVDVEALVNYFAGAPVKPVKRGVRLETEASPAPVEANGHRGILRFTIDTATITVPQRGSVPPIAKDARLEIEFNRDAVERVEAIGDTTTLIPESVLLHNTSVTGLFALNLKMPLKEKQLVAKVRLRYRSIEDDRMHTIEKEVRGKDFAKQWPRASRRHRLASLGALWGESLRGSHGGVDVARRAEELATQAPNDQRARELAVAASASSGGGTK